MLGKLVHSAQYLNVKLLAFRSSNREFLSRQPDEIVGALAHRIGRGVDLIHG